MALAANALTTVAAVEEETGLDGVDSRIERVINAVSERFEKYCGRKFVRTTFTEQAPEILSGSGGLEIYLSMAPITAVSSVIVDDVAVTDYIRTADRDDRGALYREDGWRFNFTGWPPPDLTRDRNQSRVLRVPNVKVAYTGGYLLPPSPFARTLPYDIEMACIRECQRILVGPMPGLVEERTAGGWSQKFATGSDVQIGFLPETVAVLNRYVKPSRLFA